MPLWVTSDANYTKALNLIAHKVAVATTFYNCCFVFILKDAFFHVPVHFQRFNLRLGLSRDTTSS